MSLSMKFGVTLTRTINQRSNDDLIKTHIHDIVSKTLSGKYKKWSVVKPLTPAPVHTDGNWVFTRQLYFKFSGHRQIVAKQWEYICKRLILAGHLSRYGKYPWLVSGSGAEKFYVELRAAGKIVDFPGDVDESVTEPDANGNIQPVDKKKSILVKNFGEVNVDPGTHFDHIFDREHQIRILLAALRAAKTSNFVNRFNCVMYGAAGCAKTEILTSVGHMLGRENEAWMRLDATSTTEAGAQKILLEAAHVPPVLIVEEIEKTDEKSLRWLLGVLDHRAEIRKTNFNIGHKARNVKMLCLATVNDIALFRKVMSGALASRFPNEIYCPRPTREIMAKILTREIQKVNGKLEWIKPTLDFCMDQMGWDDPRKIVPVCLCGQDDLLGDGSYQKSIVATMPPKSV